MGLGDRLRARLRRIDQLDGLFVTAGLQGRGGASVDPETDVPDNELVTIGRAHEFGLGVPERPWLRTAFASHARTYRGALRFALVQRVEGGEAAAALTLRQLGVAMVADIQNTIATHPWKPNAPLTIELKGSSRPLIDDGQMIQSVRATVEAPGMPAELIG